MFCNDDVEYIMVKRMYSGNILIVYIGFFKFP